jgi:hypothetical protein
LIRMAPRMKLSPVRRRTRCSFMERLLCRYHDV